MYINISKVPAEVLPAIVGNRQFSEMIISMVYWDKIVNDSDKVVASLRCWMLEGRVKQSVSNRLIEYDFDVSIAML